MAKSLDEIWQGDLLNRREDAQLLYSFLIRRHSERIEDGETGAYVVNLNAGWGHGKTFFMDRLRQQMEAAGHPTAFVNAWRDDSSKEPVVAVMAAIEAALKPHFAKEEGVRKFWDAAKANSATIMATLAKSALRQIIRKGIGDGIEQVEAILEHDDIFSEDVEQVLVDPATKENFEKTEDEITTLLTSYVDQKLKDYQARIASSSTFQKRLNQVVDQLSSSNKVEMPFFILIDELDRCRPTYAIEMLEQVKHLFDINNTIFLIATDGDQLAHSIKAVYGEGFDGKKYLLRFFQRHYKFEHRDLSEFCAYLFSRYKIDMSKVSTPLNSDIVELFVGAMQAYDVTLRDAEQCFDILRSIVTVWDYAVPIQASVMIPLIIRYQKHDMVALNDYIETDKHRDNVEPKWNVNIKVRQDFRGQITKTVSVHDLNDTLINRAKRSFREIYEYHGGSPQSDFTRDVLQAEFQVVHRNIILGEDQISIINQYPRLVRKVGRLSEPSDSPPAND